MKRVWSFCSVKSMVESLDLETWFIDKFMLENQSKYLKPEYNPQRSTEGGDCLSLTFMNWS